MVSPFHIYAHLDPRTLEIRYIGQTSKGARRQKEHARKAQLRHTHHANWIKSLPKREGQFSFDVLILEEFENAFRLDEAETEWIEEATRQGCFLTNIKPGGKTERGWKHTPEALQKMNGRHWTEQQKGAVKGRVITAQARKKLSDKAKGRELSADHKQKIIAALGKCDPKKSAMILWNSLSRHEQKTKMDRVRAAWRGKHTDETKARLIAKLQSPEVRQRRTAGLRTAESRAKASASSKASWRRRKEQTKC